MRLVTFSAIFLCSCAGFQDRLCYQTYGTDRTGCETQYWKCGEEAGSNEEMNGCDSELDSCYDNADEALRSCSGDGCSATFAACKDTCSDWSCYESCQFEFQECSGGWYDGTCENVCYTDYDSCLDLASSWDDLRGCTDAHDTCQGGCLE